MDTDSRLSELDESQLSNPPLSDSDSSDSSSDADDDVSGQKSNVQQQQQQQPEPQTEWLATTRARRSNAGNRMKSMLANEDPDSDMELLFAEDENDEGFSDAQENASDVQMDSSSDDDDDAGGANGGGDDELEGERELERQAREKRAAQRKRKAQAAIPAKFRKRVRIVDAAATSEASSGPTTPALEPGGASARRPRGAAAPAPRPRKKSQRLSWLPSPADLPTRASSRETTRMSKEQLHQQMVEREERRLKQLQIMQKKAEMMEALKKPPMTQEDRLREAEEVEERNSKSLNRWEVAEKQREEERMAKLAALRQRTLKGPVITFWSGIGEARRAVVEEEKPKKKPRERADKTKSKAANAAASSKNAPAKDDVPTKLEGQVSVDVRPDAGSSATIAATSSPKGPQARPAQSSSAATTLSASGDASREIPTVGPDVGPLQPQESVQKAAPARSPSSTLVPPSSVPPSDPPHQLSPRQGNASADKSSKPNSVLAAPVLAPPPAMAMDFTPGRNPKSNVLAPPNTSPLAPGPAPPQLLAQSREPPPAALPTTTARFMLPDDIAQGDKGTSPDNRTSSRPLEPSLQQPAAREVTSMTTTRSAIILRSFDEEAIKDKGIQTEILFGRRMDKLSKPLPTQICAITNLPARYRDPKTGIPFYNASAYREIQRLNRGEHHFSKILNAWVGSNTAAARGVPERFLNPSAPGGKKKEEEKDKDKEKESEKTAEDGDKAETTQKVGDSEPVKQEARASPTVAAGQSPTKQQQQQQQPAATSSGIATT